MTGLVVAVAAVQLLTLLAVCIHDRQALRLLRRVAADQKSVKDALSSIRTILEKLEGINTKMDTALASADTTEQDVCALHVTLGDLQWEGDEGGCLHTAGEESGPGEAAESVPCRGE